jgi:hypothetical protein
MYHQYILFDFYLIITVSQIRIFMNHFIKLPNDLIGNILIFLIYDHVYSVSNNVCKQFNACVRTLKINEIVINSDEMLNKINKTQRNVYAMPREIIFIKVRLPSNDEKIIDKSLLHQIVEGKTKNVSYYLCDINNNLIVPNGAIKLFFYLCRNTNDIIPKIMKAKKTLKELTIDTYDDIKDDNIIKNIFSLKLTSLDLRFSFLGDKKNKLSMAHLDILKNNKKELRKISIGNFVLDESCEDLNFLKDFDLIHLGLPNCEFNVKKMSINIFAQKLISLDLDNTIVDDEFIEQINICDDNVLKLELLDLSGTKISEKSFKSLKKLNYLTDLRISNCKNIECLAKLDIPSLTSLKINYNDFDDVNICYVLQSHPNLKFLELAENKKITNETLKHIKKYKLKLRRLFACNTKITFEGVLEYLSKMNLTSPPWISHNHNYSREERQKLLEANVYQL